MSNPAEGDVDLADVLARLDAIEKELRELRGELPAIDPAILTEGRFLKNTAELLKAIAENTKATNDLLRTSKGTRPQVVPLNDGTYEVRWIVEARYRSPTSKASVSLGGASAGEYLR